MRDHASQSPLDLTRAALRLRAWARGALLRGETAPAPAESADAWRIFLAAERCARPLAARVRGLDAPARAALGVASIAEMQRVLGARRTVRRVAAVAAEAGVAVALLKGGVLAFDDDAALDLVDVDVLAPAPLALRLAGRLEAAGLGDAAPGATGDAHARPQVEPGGAAVEVHHALGAAAPAADDALWSRTRPLPAAPPLLRLGAADHLAHVLAHATVEHPHRRGALRDLLLLRDALADAGATARDAEATAGQLPRERRDTARALLAAVRGPSRDAFADVAAASYLLRALAPGRLGRWARDPSFALAVHPFLGGRADLRALLRAGAAWRAPAGRWNALSTRAPHAAALARVALNALRLPPALGVALLARRLATAARATSLTR